METSQKVDYLSCTIKTDKRHVQTTWPDGLSTRVREERGKMGYNSAIRYDDGRLEMWHSDKPDLGVHLVMSGQVLDRLDMTPALLEHFTRLQRTKITRVDCAVDALDSGLNFDELWALAQAGKYQCRLRGEPLRVHSTVSGDTIYFGKMTSTVYTRIYDKAAEQKAVGDWKRIETVFRQDRAQAAAKKLITGTTPTALSLGHLNFSDCAVYGRIMADTPEKTHRAALVKENRALWLMRSAAPALAREIVEDEQFWNKFRDAVWGLVEKYKYLDNE